MPSLTLAANAVALHDQTLAAGVVTDVTIPVRANSSEQNLVRIFNRGTGAIFHRGGATVTAGDSQAYLLEPGASVDMSFSDLVSNQIALVSSAGSSFTIERRRATNVYRQAPGSGGGGGGGSTDVSALAKESGGNLAATVAALGSGGQLHSDLGLVYGRLSTDPATQTTLAAVLAKLSADPATQTTLAALNTKTSSDQATQTTLAAVLAKLTSDPATQTTLAALNSKTSNDQATQTTLAALLALSNPSVAQGTSLGALNAEVTLTPGRRGVVAIQVTGTFVGILSLMGQVDGTNYQQVTSASTFTNLVTGAQVSSITAAGLYLVSVNGLVGAKVRMTGYTSGAAIVSTSLVDGAALTALDAPLPAGTNQVGGVFLTAGGTTVAVKAASTAAAATDPALVVAKSPNDVATASRSSLNLGAGTNSFAIKASAGTLLELGISNQSGAKVYVKLYEKATGPTVGTDVPVLVIPVASDSYVEFEFGSYGKRFNTGIAVATTAAGSDTDATAVAAGVKLHSTYI